MLYRKVFRRVGTFVASLWLAHPPGSHGRLAANFNLLQWHWQFQKALLAFPLKLNSVCSAIDVILQFIMHPISSDWYWWWWCWCCRHGNRMLFKGGGWLLIKSSACNAKLCSDDAAGLQERAFSFPGISASRRSHQFNGEHKCHAWLSHYSYVAGFIMEKNTLLTRRNYALKI